jgi:hypothetical protein
MGRRTQSYEIRQAARGSFIGALGRVRYDVEPGTFSEKDLDPEVLGVLLASGVAVKAARPAESEERT